MNKQNDNPEVQIAVIHTQLGYIQKGMESIEQKIDKFPDRFASKDEVIQIKQNVDSLMKWRYYFTGAAAAVGAFVSLIINTLITYFNGHHLL